MPSRYYIAPVIGDGLTTDTAYQAQVTAAPYDDMDSYIPNKADGTPRVNWAILRINAVDQTPFLADTNLTALPNIGLDVGLTANQCNAINTKLNNLMANPPIVTAGTTLRNALQQVRDAIGPSA